MKQIKFLLILPLLLISGYVFSQDAKVQGVQTTQEAKKGSIPMPELTNTNEQLWYWYWEDQLKVNNGKVEKPGDQFNDVAKISFAKAKEQFRPKEVVRRNIILFFISLGALITLIYVMA